MCIYIYMFLYVCMYMFVFNICIYKVYMLYQVFGGWGGVGGGIFGCRFLKNRIYYNWEVREMKKIFFDVMDMFFCSLDVNFL